MRRFENLRSLVKSRYAIPNIALKIKLGPMAKEIMRVSKVGNGATKGSASDSCVTLEIKASGCRVFWRLILGP